MLAVSWLAILFCSRLNFIFTCMIVLKRPLLRRNNKILLLSFSVPVIAETLHRFLECRKIIRTLPRLKIAKQMLYIGSYALPVGLFGWLG